MKNEEIVGLLRQGKPLVIGEYRRSKAEVITWRDKESGRPMSAPSIRHTVETPDETFEVSDFIEVPEGKTAEDIVRAFVPLFNKGAEVLVVVKGWQAAKGVVKCRGELHALKA